MSDHNFSEYYKTISNEELISILENQDDYQPLAIEAAKAEMANRQLSDTEIEAAKQILNAKQIQKEKSREKVKAVESKIKTTGDTFIETLNPIQSGIPSAEKTIRFIFIIFSCLFLYQLVSDFRNILAYFENILKFPFVSLTYLLPTIILLVALFYFWKRKSAGWVLLTAYLAFSAVGAFWMLLYTFMRRKNEVYGFEIIFPQPSPLNFVFQLLFLLGVIYVLCRKNIREIFSVDKQVALLTIVISGLLSLVIIFIS